MRVARDVCDRPARVRARRIRWGNEVMAFSLAVITACGYLPLNYDKRRRVRLSGQ
jgi:hypothetical protein